MFSPGREDISRRFSSARTFLLSPAGITAAVTAAFILISVWWVLADTRPPNVDSGVHLVLVDAYRGLIDAGHPKVLFQRFDVYTPFVHMTGALASYVIGTAADAQMILQNVIFVPLLALGCYGAGTVAYDRRVGALAAVFALASPLVITQFHTFMTDAPLTSMVAVTVWLLLASNRFANRRYAIAAGVAVGLGMMTKNTFPAFLAGFMVVFLLRGGWRNYVNIAWFAGAAAIVFGPWYIEHWSDLREEARYRATLNLTGFEFPEKWTLEDHTWYGWSLVNNQFYVPLTIFLVIGIVFALRAWLRRREPTGYAPELLVGAFVAVVVVAHQLVINDARYSLPYLVYLAVIATAWIPRVPRRVGIAATAALAVILVVNTLTTNLGLGSHTRIALPGAKDNSIGEGHLTLISGEGFTELAEPDRDAQILERLEDAKAAGIRRVSMTGEPGSVYWSGQGMDRVRDEAGLEWGGDIGRLGPEDLHVYRRNFVPGLPPPCTQVDELGGIYFVRGDPAAPHQSLYQYDLYCPGRDYPRGLRPP